MTTVLLVICGVLFGLCALLMTVAILLQESKGGGLAALGGTRAESAFGASNPLRKLTVVLSIIFFVLAGGLSLWLRPPPMAFKPVGEPEPSGQTPPGGTSVTVPIEPAKEPAKEPTKEPAKEPAKEPVKETPKPPAEKPAADEKPAPAPAPAPKPGPG